MLSPLTVVGIFASAAPGGGSNTSPGLPASASLAKAALAAGAEVMVRESHMSGVGLVKTVCPAGSTAARLPVSASADTASPIVFTW
ncbi:hypothetical protein SMICM17S_05091 [Streptomyces microflavus]